MTHDNLPIDSKGIWIGKNAKDFHYFDERLALSLVYFFAAQNALSVVDFGCGLGDYVTYFRAHDLYVDGFDGNPSTPELTKDICGVRDLSVSFDLGQRYDWVLSLEVGEHLPQQYETIFIDNLIRHCKKGIVISWAVKGQGGTGHYNEQNNDYIKQAFAVRGFSNDVDAENLLRKNCALWWFKNSLMVFFKK